jgi:hypothetical protein
LRSVVVITFLREAYQAAPSPTPRIPFIKAICIGALYKATSRSRPRLDRHQKARAPPGGGARWKVKPALQTSTNRLEDRWDEPDRRRHGSPTAAKSTAGIVAESTPLDRGAPASAAGLASCFRLGGTEGKVHFRKVHFPVPKVLRPPSASGEPTLCRVGSSSSLGAQPSR